MRMFGRDKKASNQAVKQFKDATGCPDQKLAISLLSKHKNNVEMAIGEYFDKGLDKNYKKKTISSSKVIDAIFDSYAGISLIKLR